MWRSLGCLPRKGFGRGTLRSTSSYLRPYAWCWSETAFLVELNRNEFVTSAERLCAEPPAMEIHHGK